MRPHPRVVIVGAGFGGLQCAKALRDQPVDVHDPSRTVTLLYGEDAARAMVEWAISPCPPSAGLAFLTAGPEYQDPPDELPAHPRRRRERGGRAVTKPTTTPGADRPGFNLVEVCRERDLHAVNAHPCHVEERVDGPQRGGESVADPALAAAGD